MADTLSSDITDFPPCPTCKHNQDGYWTCRAISNNYVYECVKCDTTWAQRSISDAREYLDGKTLGVTRNGRRYTIHQRNTTARLTHERDTQSLTWTALRDMLAAGRMYAPHDYRDVRESLALLASATDP